MQISFNKSQWQTQEITSQRPTELRQKEISRKKNKPRKAKTSCSFINLDYMHGYLSQMAKGIELLFQNISSVGSGTFFTLKHYVSHFFLFICFG